MLLCGNFVIFFVFKQKTAYEMRISDWSSDVCSSDLFDIGGELAMPGHVAIADTHVEQLEQWAEAFNADLPPLKEFVLPGGSAAAAQAHLSRAIARRDRKSVV